MDDLQELTMPLSIHITQPEKISLNSQWLIQLQKFQFLHFHPLTPGIIARK